MAYDVVLKHLLCFCLEFKFIMARRLASLLLATILGGAISTQAQNATIAQKCSALASSFYIQNVTVNFAQFVPAGTNLTFSQGKDNYRL